MIGLGNTRISTNYAQTSPPITALVHMMSDISSLRNILKKSHVRTFPSSLCVKETEEHTSGSLSRPMWRSVPLHVHSKYVLKLLSGKSAALVWQITGKHVDASTTCPCQILKLSRLMRSTKWTRMETTISCVTKHWSNHLVSPVVHHRPTLFSLCFFIHLPSSWPGILWVVGR